MNQNNDRLQLLSRTVGPWPMNSYALVCPQTGDSILIDPGADPDTLMEMLADSHPTAILLTHTHPDHIGALSDVSTRLSVPLLAHNLTKSKNLSPAPDKFLENGEVVEVGHYSLRVHHTPGHIDDQICLLLENDDRALVGDTIFAGGPGKTWSSKGFQETLVTLRTVILNWPDETVCYPGHGPSFLLGEQKPAIEIFLSKEHKEFFGDATWEM